MRYFNGNVYTGEWDTDCFDGLGEYSWSDGRRFVGHFKKDKMEGMGSSIWPDGRKYEGEYKADLAHGHGTVTLADGRFFEGEFRDDFPIEGQLIESDGETYQASFDGETHVSDWRPSSKMRVGAFEGGWRSFEARHALCEFVWSDGRRFAGACVGRCPLIGVLTDAGGVQHCVSYGGGTLFCNDPTPLHSIRLRTQARRARPHDQAAASQLRPRPPIRETAERAPAGPAPRAARAGRGRPSSAAIGARRRRSGRRRRIQSRAAARRAPRRRTARRTAAGAASAS
jgi:hypothetical protein